MQALHFGAGNIGRGFIGYLLSKTGYELCFVDVNEEIIEEINETNSYKVELLDDNSTRETVSPVTALNSIKEREKVIQAIIEADLITTSVGVENLAKIAGLIAEGLLKRIEKNKTKVDVIANENAVNASSTLKQEVEKNLSTEEMIEISKYVGFPNWSSTYTTNIITNILVFKSFQSFFNIRIYILRRKIIVFNYVFFDFI